MPGKQRGKMELPAGNANRRRFMCGGESHGGTKRKKLMGGGAPKATAQTPPKLKMGPQATAQPNPPKLQMGPPATVQPNLPPRPRSTGMGNPLGVGNTRGGVRGFKSGGKAKKAKKRG